MASVDNRDVRALMGVESGLHKLFWGSLFSLLSLVQIEGIDSAKLAIFIVSSLGMLWCVWGILELVKAHWGTSLEGMLICLAIMASSFTSAYIFSRFFVFDAEAAPQIQSIARGLRALQLLGIVTGLFFCICMILLVNHRNLGTDIRSSWRFTLIAVVAGPLLNSVSGVFQNIPWLLALKAISTFIYIVAIAFYLGSLRITRNRIQDVIDNDGRLDATSSI